MGFLLPFGCTASTASSFLSDSAVLTAGLESWYSRNRDTTVWTPRLSLLTLSRILWNADCPSLSRHPIMVCGTQVPRKRRVRDPMLPGLDKQALNSMVPADMTFLWHLMVLSLLQHNSLTSWHGSVLVRTCLSELKSLSCVRLFATLWTVAYQVPLSMGFSRQEYWSGLPYPSPEDLPNPGIEPGSPSLQADALPPGPPGKSKVQCLSGHSFSAFLDGSSFKSVTKSSTWDWSQLCFFSLIHSPFEKLSHTSLYEDSPENQRAHPELCFNQESQCLWDVPDPPGVSAPHA